MMLQIIDDADAVRYCISTQSWVAHQKLLELAMEVRDKRIKYLILLMGIEPDKTSPIPLTPEEVREKVEKYKETLASMTKKMGLD